MSSCPCGSEFDFSACCGPALDGSVSAKSAEALMRSRYTAHARGALDYLEETHVPLDGAAAPSLGGSAGDVTWTHLEIVEANGGGVADDTGVVEFRASYRTHRGEHGIYHERSRFRRIEGRWVYTDGDLIAAAPARATPKPGRNAPCPCGSGKKSKHCCAG